MKYKVKSKDCLLKIQVKASFGENIEEKLFDNFSRVYIRGFLKVKKLGKNKYEYSGPIGVSLKDRFQKPISKRDVLFIVEHIIFAIQKLQNAKFPIEYLVTDMNNIYFNENTKELQFLYIPMINAKEKNDVMGLFSNIIYSVKPLQENDTEYLSRLHYFLANINVNYGLIENFVMREDRSVINTIKKQNTGQSGYMTNKQQHYYDHYDNKDEDDEATGLLDEDDEATGLLDEGEETGLLEEDDATGLLNDSGMQLNQMLKQEICYATLYRVLTDETIKINKPVFRLGKERSYVDYFVTNNIAVSRSHADIITRAGKHYVIDLNSKNHTYINGKEIPVQVEMEIMNGDKLTLGNEEFIFKD